MSVRAPRHIAHGHGASAARACVIAVLPVNRTLAGVLRLPAGCVVAGAGHRSGEGGAGMDKGLPGRSRHAFFDRRCTLLRPLLCLLALLAVPAHADLGDSARIPLHRWSWQTWSSEAGLPQISGKALALDHEGVMWVGTENGLARFDGSRFEVFTPGNTPQLSSAWITRLMVDREGRVWIGNLRNVAVYADGRFIGSDELGEVSALAQTGDGEVLVGAGRLYHAGVDGGQLLLQAEDTVGAVSALLAAPARGLWIAERAGWLRHRDDSGETLRPLPAELARVTALAWYDDTLWLGGEGGLYRFDGDRFQPVNFAAASQPVQAMAIDPRGCLWIASHGDVYRRHSHGGMETVASQAAHAFPWVMAFLPTEDGIWMGSLYHGLRYYWLPPVQRLGHEEGLQDPSLWAVIADGDGILIGTDAGVARWDGRRFREVLPPSALPHPAAYSVLRDRNGRIWAGTRSGLARFDPATGSTTGFERTRGTQINGLHEDDDGRIWIASATGLFRHPGGDAGDIEEVNANGLLSGMRIRAIERGSDGELWLATESGLFVLNGTHAEPVTGTGIDGAFVTSVRVLADGKVVVGTYDRGIAVRGRDGLWSQHSIATGLPSDTVFSMHALGDGVLVSYSSGAYGWHVPDTGQATPAYRMFVYDFGDRPGRSRIRCCNGGGNDKGTIHLGAFWLPTLNGLVRVPLDIQPMPTPVVDVLDINGRKADADDVRLAVGERQLAVHFRSIDYRYGFLQQFRYRLQGVDAGWIETPSRDPITYAQVPPGRFRFEMQARLPFRPWGKMAAVQIDVPPRFVETWTFRTLMAIAAMVLLAVLMRWRERRLRQQKERLEALIATRTGELAQANRRLGELNQVLNEASLSDPLTGLGNRRHLLNVVAAKQEDVRRAWQDGATSPVLGLMVIDIDHFKQINDALGHLAGDTVLSRIARLLGRLVGEEDGLARWGGEEFVVVTCVDRVEDLLDYAECLRRAVEAEAIEVTPQRQVTASIGVAAWPTAATQLDRHDWTVSLGLADFALYRAKVSGRNRSALIKVTGVAPEAWPERPDAGTVREWLETGRAELHLRP